MCMTALPMIVSSFYWIMKPWVCSISWNRIDTHGYGRILISSSSSSSLAAFSSSEAPRVRPCFRVLLPPLPKLPPPRCHLLVSPPPLIQLCGATGREQLWKDSISPAANFTFPSFLSLKCSREERRKKSWRLFKKIPAIFPHSCFRSPAAAIK